MDLPRSSGLLLHITSLPSPHGIGDLGPGAYRFADFLARTGQRVWQMLPLVPPGAGHSPYSSPSTFAGNPLLISPERLREQGLLADEDLTDRPAFPDDEVDFGRVTPYKQQLLERAFERFEADQSTVDEAEFDRFCQQEADWLDDYALFRALQDTRETVWTQWPRPLALRDPEALKEAKSTHARRIRMRQFWQFLFARQWAALRAYCHARKIRLFGDLPIYVAHNSADVWAHPELFYLDESGQPTVISGVPPDYFSETGQRWGNPLYRWDRMKEHGYQWWTRRFRSVLAQVDLVRLDHFRGFEAYWEIPAEEETAIEGCWVDGPGADLFDAVQQALGSLPLVAEDLGVITPEVTELMKQFAFPGMAVLQFAFDDPDSDFLPHNHKRNLVAYTGTHDNNTIAGWWNDVADDPDVRAFARRYLDLDEEREQEMHWKSIRAVMGSVARLAVFPLQDVLGLGSDARMNTPGRGRANNWSWRLAPDQLGKATGRRLKLLTQTYGRAPDRKAAQKTSNPSEKEHLNP